jgi:hypothetical protein
LPGETRIRWRDRFSRFLPSWPGAVVIKRGGSTTLANEDLLQLHLEISFTSNEQTARAVYLKEQSKASGEPDFDTLIRDHWLRVIWGRNLGSVRGVGIPAPYRHPDAA